MFLERALAGMNDRRAARALGRSSAAFGDADRSVSADAGVLMAGCNDPHVLDTIRTTLRDSGPGRQLRSLKWLKNEEAR